MSRSRIVLGVLFFAALLMPIAPASASSYGLCSGYSTCTKLAYPTFGYSTAQYTSYWRMYTGTNCTNYVAYRLVTTNGMPNVRPKSGVGNARDWGYAMASVTDSRPVVGSVAWWGVTGHHVAYVEKVVSSTEILVSESNWNGAFDWRRITKSGSGWPDGFIHFKDLRLENTARPVVSGTVKVGSTLTTSVGTWSPTPSSYTYRWLSDGIAITGATSRTFVPTAAELGRQLSVTVRASRTRYPSASATSIRTVVAPGSLSATQRPTATGMPRVGETLTASTGTWSPAGATYSYQWLADDVPVEGSTASTFEPGPAQVRARIRIEITASKPAYAPVKRTSVATAAVVVGHLANVTAPTVSGTPRVGSRLTADPGTWSRPGLTYAYQWFVDGAAITGGTGATYVPVAADLHRAVSVTVTASRPGYAPSSAASRPTSEVARGILTLQAAPTTSGTVRVGARLTASPGTWAPAADYSYRWYDENGLISGATSQSFVLGPAQRGHVIRVRVTARRAGYSSVNAVSARTAEVAYGRITFSKAPTIAGTPRLNSVLRVDPGTYKPTTGSIRYQWLRGGKALAGATGRTRRVKEHDIGSALSVRVTVSAPGYTTRKVITAVVKPR